MSEQDEAAVLKLLTVGQYNPFGSIEGRAKSRGLDLTPDALVEVLTRLVSKGPLSLTYGRGYFYPTPYDTGAILEPRIWEPRRQLDRYGRVDFDNEESATEVTVWVEMTDDGPLVHVIGHGDNVTVIEE